MLRDAEKVAEISKNRPKRPPLLPIPETAYGLAAATSPHTIKQKYFSEMQRCHSSEDQCRALANLTERIAPKGDFTPTLAIPPVDAQDIVHVLVACLFEDSIRHLHKFIVLLVDRVVSVCPGVQPGLDMLFDTLLEKFLTTIVSKTTTTMTFETAMEIFNELDALTSHCKPIFLGRVVARVECVVPFIARGLQLCTQATLGKIESVAVSAAMSQMRFVLRVIANLFTRGQLGVTSMIEGQREWDSLCTILYCVTDICSQPHIYPKDMLNAIGLIITAVIADPWTAELTGGALRPLLPSTLHEAVIGRNPEAVRQWIASFGSTMGTLCIVKGAFLRFGVCPQSGHYICLAVGCTRDAGLDAASRFYALQTVEVAMTALSKVADDALVRALTSEAQLKAVLDVMFEMWEDADVGYVSSQMLETLFISVSAVCVRTGMSHLVTPDRIVLQIPWVYRCKYPTLQVLAKRLGVGTLLSVSECIIPETVSALQHHKVCNVAGELLLYIVHSDPETFIPLVVRAFADHVPSSEHIAAGLATHVFAPFCKAKPGWIPKFLPLLKPHVSVLVLLLKRLRNINALGDCLDAAYTELKEVFEEALLCANSTLRNDMLEVVALQKKAMCPMGTIEAYLLRNVKTGDTSFRSLTMTTLQKIQAKLPPGDMSILNVLLAQCYPGCPLDRRIFILDFWSWFLTSYEATSVEATLPALIGPLLTSFTEGWDRVRTVACDILLRYPDVSALHPTTLEAWAMRCLDSSKRKVSESGSLALFVVAQKTMTTPQQRVNFLESFLTRLKERIMQNQKDYPYMSHGVHGTLMILRLSLAQWCQEDVRESLAPSVRAICEAACEVMRGATTLVTSSADEDGEEINVDCRGHVILEGISPLEQRRVVTYAWLAVKDSAEVLESVVATSLAMLPVSLCTNIGHACIQALLRTKHNGVMSKSKHALLVLSHHCLRHTNADYVALPTSFLVHLLQESGVRCTNKDRILRRSQGLPPAIVALLESEDPNLPRKLFPHCLESLLDLLEGTDATTPPPLEHKINALNVLRYILECHAMSRPMGPFIERLLLVVLKGIQDCNWSMRNSCMMVHAQLVSRIAGDHATHRCTTYQDARTKYPQAMQWMQREMERNQTSDGDAYLLLLLFSAFLPNPSVMCDTQLLQSVLRRVGSKELLVRQMAAEAIVPLMGSSETGAVVTSLLQESRMSGKNNFLHGAMLALRSIQKVYPTAVDFVTIQDRLGPEAMHRLASVCVAPIVCVAFLKLIRGVTPSSSGSDSFLGEISEKLLVSLGTSQGLMPGVDTLVSEVCEILLQLGRLPTLLQHPWVTQPIIDAIAKEIHVAESYSDDVTLRHRVLANCDNPGAMAVLRTMYSANPTAARHDDISSLLRFLKSNVLVTGSSASGLSHVVLAEGLILAATLACAKVPQLDVSDLYTVCQQWSNSSSEGYRDVPVELRKAVALSLTLLARSGLFGYLPLPLCYAVVALLYDEEDEVRPMAADIVSARHLQIEVAIEKHFALVAHNHATSLGIDDLTKRVLYSNGCSGAVQDLQAPNEELIFDVETPNYYIEEIQVAQYFASLARRRRGGGGGEGTLPAPLVAFLEQHPHRSVREKPPFGQSTDWPSTWSEAYRALLVAWALCPAHFRDVVQRLGLESCDASCVHGAVGVLLRDGVKAPSRSVLFLLSADYLTKVGI